MKKNYNSNFEEKNQEIWRKNSTCTQEQIIGLSELKILNFERDNQKIKKMKVERKKKKNISPEWSREGWIYVFTQEAARLDQRQLAHL